MFEFLTEDEGYSIKWDNDIVNGKKDIDSIIKDIKKCEVDDIHYPIKNTLLNYYNNQKISEKFTIFAFSSNNFAYVWEFICKKILHDNKEFKKEEMKVLLKPLIFGEEREKIPDIFSVYNDKKFVGDAKYYANFDSEFVKELYQYNEAIDDKYPVTIFLPNLVTEMYKSPSYSSGKKHELIVITLSMYDMVSDFQKTENKTIEKVHQIISDNTIRNF